MSRKRIFRGGARFGSVKSSSDRVILHSPAWPSPPTLPKLRVGRVALLRRGGVSREVPLIAGIRSHDDGCFAGVILCLAMVPPVPLSSSNTLDDS